jgi:hypothetical protein
LKKKATEVNSFVNQSLKNRLLEKGWKERLKREEFGWAGTKVKVNEQLMFIYVLLNQNGIK